MGKIKFIFNIIWKVIHKLLIVAIILMFVLAVIQKVTNNKGSIAGFKIFTVITGSMIPVYNIGDILIVREIEPHQIKVDDDIVYNGEKGTYKNKTITHRVISIEKQDDGNYKIITKGVANLAQDPIINQTQVIGKVVGKVSIISFILKLLNNIYILIFIPVGILIYKNFKKIRNMEEN